MSVVVGGPSVVNCRYTKNFDVYIGRGTKWGNPYRADNVPQRRRAVQQYRAWLETQPDLIMAAKTELRGKVLACWCKPFDCYGDVLLEVANA